MALITSISLLTQPLAASAKGNILHVSYWDFFTGTQRDVLESPQATPACPNLGKEVGGVFSLGVIVCVYTMLGHCLHARGMLHKSLCR